MIVIPLEVTLSNICLKLCCHCPHQ